MPRPLGVVDYGTAPLTLGSLTLPAGFSVVADLFSPVAPGSSVVFRVQLDTSVMGTKSGDITFTNNDGNENPFNVRIAGFVVAAAPAATVTGGVGSLDPSGTGPGYVGWIGPSSCDQLNHSLTLESLARYTRGGVFGSWHTRRTRFGAGLRFT
ncbi:MAG: hypothetical protein MUC88_19795 [Planctomycetes bacterium]|nr:hypothetical protein [Planctomycetota bacterium]